MAYGVVYDLIDITSDREYVGQTVQPVEKRFKEHFYEKTYIGNAMRAIGKENFLIVILKECDSKEELDRWEKHLIKSRDTLAPNGYNLREGGEGGGKLCAESIAKMSASRKGKKRPPEVGAKVSAKLTGRKKSPEHIAKVAAARHGKKQPPEAVVKQAVATRKPSPYRVLQNEIEKRALTYTEIAKAIGIAINAFSNKMLGKEKFRPAQKLLIKNFLGVEMSVEELFAREDD